MLKSIKDASREIRIKWVFFGIAVTGITGFIIAVFATSGNAFQHQFFSGCDNLFMDFFNCIKFSQSKDPYGDYGDIGAMYPPLAFLVYRLFAVALPNVNAVSDVYSSGYSIRNSFIGLVLYLIITFICFVVLFFIVYKCYRGREFERAAFAFFIMVSSPFIYLAERGNILLISITLNLLFFVLIESEKKYVREIAIICLAVSAALKLYPALFGLYLLVKFYKTDKKLILRCVAYGIALFVFPFAPIGGIPAMKKYFDVLFYVSGLFEDQNLSNIFCKRVDLTGVVTSLTVVFRHFFKLDVNTVSAIASAVRVIFLVQFSLGFFLLKPKWQKLLCLTILMIIIPFFSFYYCIANYLIPLFFFMTKKVYTKLDYAFAVAFALLFIPFSLGATLMKQVFSFSGNGFWSVTLANYAQAAIFILVFAVIAVAEFKALRKLITKNATV